VRFLNREDAGLKLAQRLSHLRAERPVVIALPRGGVVVADVVARALDAPLDVLVVRKLGAPHQPELAIGAVAEDGTLVADERLIELFGLSNEELTAMTEVKRAEIAARIRRYRGERPLEAVEGKTVILVDDGIATGATAHAAARALRARRPERLVLAVPVAASQTLRMLEREVDELACLEASPELIAVGYWYVDFRQISDHEVVQLLGRARARTAGGEQPVRVQAGDVELEGTLDIPAGASGLVVFAHGSGSSR
jgi:putative phosphoribosyl transferase